MQNDNLNKQTYELRPEKEEKNEKSEIENENNNNGDNNNKKKNKKEKLNIKKLQKARKDSKIANKFNVLKKWAFQDKGRGAGPITQKLLR